MKKRGPKPSHRYTGALIEKGYKVVVGIDEVGRGCLAGPVTAAAVILAPGTKVAGASDSKVLDLKTREKLAMKIKATALVVGVGWASHEEVDQYGLTWAVRQSGLRALEDMGIEYDAVLLDGNHNYLKEHCYAETLIKGDSLCLSIACASIVAKVARDNFMKRMHDIYPNYGWFTNVGYATKTHMEAMKQELSPLHRRLFAPVAKMNQLSMEAFYERVGVYD